MNIEELLIKNSGWTWDRLRDSRKFDFQISEESITDFVILNLKKYGGDKLIVKSFTRHQEALNGADWEWWFTGPSGSWLGMRIQAKIINLKSEKYEHLYHQNRHGPQIDQLINDASRYGLVPLYCMYSNWNPNKYRTPKKCLTYKPSVKHYGHSILSPDIVNDLKNKNTKHISAIIKHLAPVHCVFCSKCNGAQGDLPLRAFKYLQAKGFTKIYENKNYSLEKILLKNKVPNYVQQVLEGSILKPTEKSEEGIERTVDLDIVDDLRLKRITVIKEINNQDKTASSTGKKSLNSG